MQPMLQARPTLPSIDEVGQAAELVYRVMPPTPQYCWPLLCERLGTELWVKHENQTPTGSFKARTAIVYVEELMKREPETRGLIAATRGNHGQSVALAAKRFALPAIIVVPHGNSVEKNAAMRGQGARLIERGHDYQSSREHCGALATEMGYHFVPPYHREIVKGVSTYWLELFKNVADIDVVYVPIGMGSGSCSAAAVRNGLGLKTKIVGVVSEEAPAQALSFEQKKCVEAPANARLADGLACRKPEQESLNFLLENLERVVRVSEGEVAEAMRILFTDTHNVVEGAGAAGLAAALQEKEQLRGKRVAVVATGANVDHDVFARVLEGRWA
jgi:threonine dehydratase